MGQNLLDDAKMDIQIITKDMKIQQYIVVRRKYIKKTGKIHLQYSQEKKKRKSIKKAKSW